MRSTRDVSGHDGNELRAPTAYQSSESLPDAERSDPSGRDPALADALKALRESRQELERVRWELEETNRGVVALYQELDEATSKLRDTAQTLQRALLSEPPAIPGFEVCVRYRPARIGDEAGGDWYDIFHLPGGDLAVVVGDVAGHDIAAAATMGQLRSMLRGLAYHSDDQPHDVLTSLDRVVRGMRLSPLTTTVYARIQRSDVSEDAPGYTMTWTNAGHPSPVLIHPEVPPTVLDGPRDAALGVVPDWPRTLGKTWVPAGSTLLLFSDGLFERRGGDIDEAMAEVVRRAASAASLPLNELCDELVGQAPVDDDLVLIALRGRAGGEAVSPRVAARA